MYGDNMLLLLFCGPDKKSYLRVTIKETGKQMKRKIPNLLLGTDLRNSRQDTTEAEESDIYGINAVITTAIVPNKSSEKNTPYRRAWHLFSKRQTSINAINLSDMWDARSIGLRDAAHTNTFPSTCLDVFTRTRGAHKEESQVLGISLSSASPCHTLCLHWHALGP